MPLLVIDFTYFDGRDGELVVKELAAVHFHSNRISSTFLRDRPAGRKYQCLTLEWIKLLTTGDGDKRHSQL